MAPAARHRAHARELDDGLLVELEVVDAREDHVRERRGQRELAERRLREQRARGDDLREHEPHEERVAAAPAVDLRRELARGRRVRRQLGAVAAMLVDAEPAAHHRGGRGLVTGASHSITVHGSRAGFAYGGGTPPSPTRAAGASRARTPRPAAAASDSSGSSDDKISGVGARDAGCKPGRRGRRTARGLGQRLVGTAYALAKTSHAAAPVVEVVDDDDARPRGKAARSSAPTISVSSTTGSAPRATAVSRWYVHEQHGVELPRERLELEPVAVGRRAVRQLAQLEQRDRRAERREVGDALVEGAQRERAALALRAPLRAPLVGDPRTARERRVDRRLRCRFSPASREDDRLRRPFWMSSSVCRSWVAMTRRSGPATNDAGRRGLLARSSWRLQEAHTPPWISAGGAAPLVPGPLSVSAPGPGRGPEIEGGPLRRSQPSQGRPRKGS